jgi:hypothetical protein
MNPQPPTPPPGGQKEPAQPRPENRDEQALDRELDQELDETFPASDPLPWSHQVD